MKKIIWIYSGALCFFVFLASCSEALSQTQAILYLKNGSVIKCNLVQLIPDSLLIIQIEDKTQIQYSYDQIDSLTYSQSPVSSSGYVSQPLPSKPKSSMAGIFAGAMIPVGQNAGTNTDGLFFGGRFGSGRNPGILAEFAFDTHNTIYAMLGLRFITSPFLKGNEIFLTPLVGVFFKDEARFSLGSSLEVYVMRKVFITVHYITSVGSLSERHTPPFSLLSFGFGYGVN